MRMAHLGYLRIKAHEHLFQLFHLYIWYSRSFEGTVLTATRFLAIPDLVQNFHPTLDM